MIQMAQVSSGKPLKRKTLVLSLVFYSLGIQIPSKKVVWGVFRRSNTFSEGSWIPRVWFSVGVRTFLFVWLVLLKLFFCVWPY